MNLPSYKFVSDCAVLVVLGTQVSDEVNRQVIALDRSIASASIYGVREIVPALVNLLVIFDPLLTEHERVKSAIESLFPIVSQQQGDIAEHKINVCYEDEYSPDLQYVAKACGMSCESVINAHCSACYRVGMYGFAPGYAYLSGVPESIQIPRKIAPVRDIPAGVVMIAGAQSLITTVKMPTGWSIIGRSNARIITGRTDQPFLFNVGDTVTFRRISRDELEQT